MKTVFMSDADRARDDGSYREADMIRRWLKALMNVSVAHPLGSGQSGSFGPVLIGGLEGGAASLTARAGGLYPRAVAPRPIDRDLSRPA